MLWDTDNGNRPHTQPTHLPQARSGVKETLHSYLSAKYKNIRQMLTPSQSYTVSSIDEANAPGLAFKFYGDRGYWWVICFYNGILDPIAGFEPGLVLQLPSLADINALLSSQDDQQLVTSTVTI